MNDEEDERKWKVLAAQYRAAAKELPHGPEKEELLRKARQLEAASHARDWAASAGPQSPSDRRPKK
jgi:hypothetical protein